MRVVFSTLASSSFASVWKAAALAVAELNVAALFVVGALAAQIGSFAPWFILLAWAVSVLVRAIDIESWALFIRGGTAGRVEAAFGHRPAQVAAAATLAERLLLAALCALLIGHYIAAFVGRSGTTVGLASLQDGATGLGVVAFGVVWIRARFRRGLAPDTSARGVWIGLGILTTIGGWAAFTALFRHAGARALIVPPVAGSPLQLLLTYLVALGVALPLLGGGDVLASAAQDSPPPRVGALQRMARLAGLAGLAVSVVPAFAYAVLVHGPEGSGAANAPLAELSRHLAGPPVLHAAAALALIAAVVLIVTPILDASLSSAEQTLRRLSARRLLPVALTSLHPRLGTPTRTLDIAALAVVVMMIVSGGDVPGLGRAHPVPGGGPRRGGGG